MITQDEINYYSIQPSKTIRTRYDEIHKAELRLVKSSLVTLVSVITAAAIILIFV